MRRRRKQTVSPALAAPSVVVIGSYREDLAGLLQFTMRLTELGIHVLHPPPEARWVGEDLGFVRLDCDRSPDKGRVQQHVFSLINRADAVIVYSPAGRVGVSAAMEIGFALRARKQILCTAPPQDHTIRALVGYEPAALVQFLRTAAGAAGQVEEERASLD